MLYIIKHPTSVITIIFIWLALLACNQSVPDHDNNISIAEPVDANTADAADNPMADKAAQSPSDLGSKITNYAGSLAGIPYKEAGRDTSGFDCSGFVYYVFKKYNIDVPHSSRHMAQMGKEITMEEAKQGDLVFFRGTDPASTEIGHVGIVISGAGEKIKFIHSSSAKSSACVKLDSLEKPNYKKRFLMVKRIL